MLCLQVGHLGLSTLDNELRITLPEPKRYPVQHLVVCPVSDS
jgi:hypothetical protein